MTRCPLLDRIEALEHAQCRPGEVQRGALVQVRTSRGDAYNGLFAIAQRPVGEKIALQILRPHRLGAHFIYWPEELQLIGNPPPYTPHKWHIPSHSGADQSERDSLWRLVADDLFQADPSPHAPRFGRGR